MKKIFLLTIICVCVSFGQELRLNNNKVIIKDDGTLSIPKISIDTLHHLYAGFEDSVKTIELTQDTWTMITNPSHNLLGVGKSKNINISNDTIQFSIAGNIDGLLVLTFSGSQENEYRFRFHNTTQEGFTQGITACGVNNYIQCVLPVYINEVSPEEKFVFQVQNITGNNSIKIRSAQLILKYLDN